MFIERIVEHSDILVLSAMGVCCVGYQSVEPLECCSIFSYQEMKMASFQGLQSMYSSSQTLFQVISFIPRLFDISASGGWGAEWMY